MKWLGPDSKLGSVLSAIGASVRIASAKEMRPARKPARTESASTMRSRTVRGELAPRRGRAESAAVSASSWAGSRVKRA